MRPPQLCRCTFSESGIVGKCSSFGTRAVRVPVVVGLPLTTSTMNTMSDPHRSSVKTELTADMVESMLHDDHFVRALWHAVTIDPMTGVQVVAPEGTILYGNDQAMQMFLGPTTRAIDYVGRNASEWSNPDAFRERVTLLNDIVADGVTRQFRGIYQGRQIVSTVYRVMAGKPPAAKTPALLIISRYVHGDVKQAHLQGLELRHSPDVHLGPLDILSRRELEVLALIGEGLSLPQIAEVLGRSPHTAHDHRKAIGRKLGVDDRVRLAEMAKAAGLKPTDAALRRVRYAGEQRRRAGDAPA
jgi:DNA-binding CsgD family transcriptional regulator